MLCATAIRRPTTGPIPQPWQRSRVPLRNVRPRAAGSSGDAPSSPAPAPTARVRFRLAAPTAPASSTGQPSSDSASATSAGPAPKRLLDAAQQLASAAVDYTQGKLLAACTEALSHLGRISQATESTAGAVEGLREDVGQASAEARVDRKEQAEELESLQAQVHLLQQQLLSSSASSQRTVLADTLQWAMSHAYVGRFKYLDASTSTAIDDLYMSCQELGLGFRAGGCEKTSKRLVQDMLIKFMRDEGFWIPNALHIPQAADAGSSQVGSASECGTIKEGSIVTLSDGYEALLRRNPGHSDALQGGKRGKVLRNDHSDIPFLVLDLETGRQWWHRASHLKLAPQSGAGAGDGARGQDMPSEEARAALRVALADQVHGLTGVRPRFVREANAAGEQQWRAYRV